MKQLAISNWVKTYCQFKIKEENFSILEEELADKRQSIRICINNDKQERCVLKLFGQSQPLLDHVYNTTKQLKMIQEFEQEIYKKKAFLSHYGIGILNGHFTMCVQIPNGGSIRNYLQNENNYINIIQILEDYSNIYVALKIEGKKYHNLKVSNLFVHNNRGIYGEIKSIQDEQESSEKLSDVLDFCTCILQILLCFIENYSDYMHLLDSNLIKYINIMTSSFDTLNTTQLQSYLKEMLGTFTPDKILNLHKFIKSQNCKINGDKYLQVSENDKLYDNPMTCLEIKKDNYLTVKDIVDIEQLLEDKEKEKVLELCFSFVKNLDKIEDSNIYYYQGVALQEAVEQDSILYFLECLKINPAHINSLSRLAKIYEKQQQFKLSIECIEKSIELNPLDEIKYSQLGGIYRKLNQFSNAINAYKTCIKLDPKKIIYYYYLGVNYRLNNNASKAIKCYKIFLKYSPHNISVLYNMALAYYHNQNFQKSIQYLLKVQLLDKKNKDSQQLLDDIKQQIQTEKYFNPT